MKNEGINAPALALAILLAIGAAITALSLRSTAGYSLGGGLLLLSLLTPISLRIARQWERAVVLRFGKLQSVRGPGMFFVDSVRRQRRCMARSAYSDDAIRSGAGAHRR